MDALDFSAVEMRLLQLARDNSGMADEIIQVIDMLKAEQEKADSIKAALSEIITKL